VANTKLWEYKNGKIHTFPNLKGIKHIWLDAEYVNIKKILITVFHNFVERIKFVALCQLVMF